MTDETYPGDKPPEEPIDAQFEPAPDPLPADGKPNGPGWPGVVAAAAVAAILGAAGGAIGAGLLTPDNSAALTEEIGRLTAQQADFEARIAQMPEASDDLASLMSEVGDNSKKLNELLSTGAGLPAIDRLAARIVALESIDPGAGATPEEALRTIAALETRIDALEAAALSAATAAAAEPAGPSEAETAQARQAGAALALSAIESATRRGTAFEADYRALRAAVPANQTVRRLSPYVNGVATLSRLQTEFPAVQDRIVAAGKAEAASEPESQLSWLNRVFGDAVSVRPASEREDPLAAAIETASRTLAAGDLAASVKALATLEGGAAAAAQDWTREANRRITLEAVLEDVRLSLIEPEN